METRKHVHKEAFDATPEQLFSLLITPSSIRDWWSAARVIVIPQQGGSWTAAWGDNEDQPEYVTTATISEFKPPHRLVLCDYLYHARTGPLPFDANFATEFVVSEDAAGATLQVTQDGFPTAPQTDDFYAACKTGWENTFAGIRRHLENS